MTDLNSVQQYFVQQLPDMRRIADYRFRHLDPEQRDESVQNALALCWKHLVALFQRGRLHHSEIWKSVLWYAIRQTKCGRTAQCQMRSKDAFEGRRRGRVRFEEADLNGLIGRKTPVLDEVIFRIDVPKFLSTLKPRQRTLACSLAIGMTTNEVAKAHGVTAGAVSQFRNRFKTLYDDFFAE